LSQHFDHWKAIREKVDRVAAAVIAFENLENDEHVLDPGSEYFQNPMQFAREKLLFCMCSRCHLPYYGGRMECGEEEVEREPNEFVCLRCSRVFDKKLECEKHGVEGMVFKCFWCCRTAEWLCWGTTPFCGEYHKRPLEVVKPPWPKCDGNCQFSGHPENGTKEIYGFCTICEEERLRRQEIIGLTE
jgi:hypothetical protein